MRSSTSVLAVGGLLSGAANALPEGLHLLDAVLGIRDKTPPSSTVTIPGYTVTNPGGTIEITMTTGATPEATTYPIPPSTVTSDPQVIVVAPIIEAKVCPQPTGLTREPGVKWAGNYGCPNGQICNPEKPEGCNVWPGPPRIDFKCNDFDCIPIPSSDGDEVKRISDASYSPAWGFFHLDPRIFGLGYDIFEYDHSNNGQRRALSWLSKRQFDEGEQCFDLCDPVYKQLQAAGSETDALCDRDTSLFIFNLQDCTGCLAQSMANATRETIREKLQNFAPVLDVCEPDDAFPPGFPGGGEEVVTPPASTEITSQAPPASSETPIIPSSNPLPNTTPTTTSAETTPSETSSPATTSLPPTTLPPTTSSTPLPPSTTEPTSSVESTPAPPDSSTTSPDESTPSEASSSSGTLPDSSSSSAESPSSGSPGSPSAGSPESSSTDSPESPPTSSADVPSASAAETPGSPESQVTDSPSASDTSAPAPGTSSEPEEPENTPAPSVPIVTTDETGTRTTLGAVPDPVPTTQDTVVVPTETPGGTPAPAPPPPPSSAAFRMTVGATILATLLTVLAALA